MGTINLYPVSTEADGAWTPVGAASLHAALSDVSDASYARTTQAGYATNRGFVTFDVPILPTGSVIVSTRLVARIWCGSGGVGPEIEFLTVPPGDPEIRGAESLPFFSPRGSFYTYTWPWRSIRPAGGAWTQAKVSNVEGRLGFYNVVPPSGDGFRLAWLRLEVEYNEPPTVTIDGPFGTVTDTTRPPISWTYSDLDGDPQGAFEVEIWSGSHPTRPASGSPVYTSGVVVSSADEWTPPNLEDGSTYTAFVRVRQAWGGSDLWSSWSNGTTFTLDIPVPNVPTVAAAADPSAAKTTITVTPSSGAGVPDPEEYLVEYRDAGGAWTPVRGGNRAAADGLNPITLDDHETPFGAAREYRALAIAEVGGLEVASAYSTVATETLTMPDGSAWIVDVLDPASLNVAVVPTESRVRTWVGREVAHRPVGLGIFVVEADEPLRQDEITLLAVDTAAQEALISIAGKIRTLLYRDDRREHYYFRWVGDRSRRQIGRRWVDADELSGTSVEVARPAP